MWRVHRIQAIEICQLIHFAISTILSSPNYCRRNMTCLEFSKFISKLSVAFCSISQQVKVLCLRQHWSYKNCSSNRFSNTNINHNFLRFRFFKRSCRCGVTIRCDNNNNSQSSKPVPLLILLQFIMQMFRFWNQKRVKKLHN